MGANSPEAPGGAEDTVVLPRDEAGSGAPARTFLDGDRVAERYQVVRFLARGGMGEVYEAEDTSLHERVALKAIRPESASVTFAIERFKRELRLARRVTHPNVCRVFDLGVHTQALPEGAAAREVTFLTMEFLEGWTLREHLVRHGRLAPAEVLALAEQMAAALDAAHAAQVIHRDFTSGNVMLVPTPSASGGLRVVVTDFGLARGELRGRDGAGTLDGTLIGSPGYMSPEQVQCLPLTPASDIYSFGVVLFEMVTGRLPFAAETPMATAVQRLYAPPPSPRTWVPELAPTWETTLLRCLARAPQERFATASEAVAALRGDLRPTLETPTRFAPRGLARAGRWAALGALVLLGAGGFWALRPARLAPAGAVMATEPPPTLAPPVSTRRAVAVLAPRDLSARPESAWLSTALVELLSAELSASGKVRMLSGESVARMRRELALPEADSFAPDTLRRIRSHSGTDLVLTGAYLVLGTGDEARIRLDLHLQDANTGEAVVHLSDTGRPRELLALISRLGANLRARMGLEPLTSEQDRAVRSAMPAGSEAARLYAEGLSALRGYDAATAAECFERVVQYEPTFPLAHSALAEAYGQLFLDKQAQAAARKAFEMSGSLSREDRLLVEARYHEARGAWAQAAEAYQALFRLFPDDVEYGTALAHAQDRLGRTREALATLETLRHLPPPLGEDARIELATARVNEESSDYAASSRAAVAAVERARRVGQRQLVAAALVEESLSVRNLGDAPRSVELMAEAERLYLEVGDRGGATRAMLVRAVALTDMVRLREAERVYEEALRAVRGFRGSYLEAETVVNAAWLGCHLGRLEEALLHTREAEALFQRLELRRNATAAMVQEGMILRHLGQLDEAERLLARTAQEAQVALGDGFLEAWARFELGQLLLQRGAQAQARPQLERALGLRQAQSLNAFVAETQLALARLSLEEGHADEALALAERAREAYAAEHTPSKEGLAHAVRARALLKKSSFPEAREASARAQALAGSCEDVFIAAEVELAAAQVSAATGNREEREELSRRMQRLAGSAGKSGLKRISQEARLALTQLEGARTGP